MTTTLDTTLSIVRDQRHALIRASVLASHERANLERAVREAITVLGQDISNVSEASGLSVAEIRKILDRTPDLELAELSGAAD